MAKVNNTINVTPELLNGHDSVKLVNNDWGTIAFKIPKYELEDPKFIERELRYNCIYLLVGLDGAQKKVYVGQAKKRNNGESVLARLKEHANSKTEWYSDIWNVAAVFTNKDDTWSLDDLNALEHAIYNEIPSEKSLNGNNPNSGGADYERYTDKIFQIRSYIRVLWGDILAEDSTDDTNTIQIMPELLDNKPVEDLQSGMARIPEIVTPHKVVSAMCDMLPEEVWNDKTVFLDPACKGGEYLREIYERLMQCDSLKAKYPSEVARSNHILINQLYGIALSNISKERTKSSLNEFDVNIRVIPNYIGLLKGMKYGNNMQEIINREFGKDMKIDVVIGNPPYQEKTGGGAEQFLCTNYL